MLAVAVLAMGWAGPLVRWSASPALAIALWRLLFALAVIAAFGTISGWTRPRASDWLAAVLAGVFLAAHFWSWIASVELTTVSSSVALVSMQPVFVAMLSATFLGERPTRTQWVGIAIAVSGAFVIAWGDFGRGRDALRGDALALAGAVLVSVYYVIGRSLRQRLDLWTYTGIVYGVAALVLLVAGLGSGVELLRHPGREWALFAALAALPTLLGHTGANYALAHFRAYKVNLALLGEPVIASLLAWGLPGIREAPPLQTAAGGLLIVGGIALGVIRDGSASHGGAPPKTT